MPLEKIKFQTNIALELALKYPEGKLCDSQFGDPQYMFTTTDDRVFFVAEKVAQKIHGLRLKPGEPFDLCKAEVSYGNGRKGIEWQIAKLGSAAGEQPDGSFVVPAAKPGAGVVETSTPASTGTSKTPVNGNRNSIKLNADAHGIGNGNSGVVVQSLCPWAQFLLTQTQQLIDVFALATNYAGQRYGTAIKAEDIRSLMLSAFINVSKNGGGNVA